MTLATTSITRTMSPGSAGAGVVPRRELAS